nr:hypothetical protein [Morganella morganii]
MTPFIVDHEIPGKNTTLAAKKGIQEVIGENVYFDYPYQGIRANIKIFSDAALNDIISGRIDLSPGYRSRYDLGDPYAAMIDEAKAVIQHDVDEMRHLFVSTVSRNRGLYETMIRNTQATDIWQLRACR